MGKTLQEVIEGLPAEQRDVIDKRADVLIGKEQERLGADTAAGLRNIDEGRATPFDEAAVERIKKRGREKLVRR